MIRRELPSPVLLRQLLLAIARTDHDRSVIGQLSWQVQPDALVNALARHQIVSLAHERLRSVDAAPQSVIEELGRRRIVAQLNRLNLGRARVAVGAALRDVPWLTVKGEALAQWYEDPALREFNDVDVLVRPGDLAEVLGRLRAGDIIPVGQNWHGFRQFEVAEIPMVVQGSSVDLHWNLVGMGESRRHLKLPTETLLQRAICEAGGGDGMLTLDPHDTLLHLCVNYGLDGGRRLRALVDIDAVLRSDRIDVAEFGRRARQAGAVSLSAAIVQRTGRLLGTPAASRVLRELATGRFWLSANRLVDRIGDVRGTTSGGIASGILLCAGRDSAIATMTALGKSSVRAIARASGRPGLTQPGGALDWQRRPQGDVESHCSDYVNWVVAQGRDRRSDVS